MAFLDTHYLKNCSKLFVYRFPFGVVLVFPLSCRHVADRGRVDDLELAPLLFASLHPVALLNQTYFPLSPQSFLISRYYYQLNVIGDNIIVLREVVGIYAI